MKHKFLKRITAILMTLSLTFSIGISQGAASETSAAEHNMELQSAFITGAVTMGVNKLYTFGLSTIGTCLTKIVEAKGSEEDKAIISFLDKWVFGNGQKKANAALIDMCKKILAELKIIETTMSEYTAQIEQSLGEQNYTEAMKTVWEKWETDVHSLEGNNIEDALKKYKDYMTVARNYADGKATEQDMDYAREAVFNEFCNIYKTKASIPLEDNTPEKLRERIFGDTIVNDIFHSSISSMKNNLLKDTNYADVLAQFAYQALPFADQQYEYIIAGINQQLIEITLLEMMHQEYLSQFGDYLTEKYPDNKSKWTGYNKLLNDYETLNEEFAANIAVMLDRDLKVWPAQNISLKLSQYPTPEDVTEVVLHNTNFMKSYRYDEHGRTHFNYPDNISDNETFQRLFTLTKTGINSFYLKTGETEKMGLPALDYKVDIPAQPDVHLPTCDYYNLYERNYSDGVNSNLRSAKNPSEVSQLFNTNVYNLIGSRPHTYLSDYLSYAGNQQVYIIFTGCNLADFNMWKTTYSTYTKVIKASDAKPISDFNENKTITLSLADVQNGKPLHDAMYSAILVSDDGKAGNAEMSIIKNQENGEIFITDKDNKIYNNVFKTEKGTVFEIKFRADEDTIVKGLKLQRKNDASNKSRITSETVLLTKEQIEEMLPDEDGYYVFECPARYSSANIYLELAKAYTVDTSTVNGIEGTVTLERKHYEAGESVCFSVGDEIEHVWLSTDNGAHLDYEIPLSYDKMAKVRTGSFEMPSKDVTLIYSAKDLNHAFDENGFCTNKNCGFYEPAVLSKEGVYEIKNAGQMFWFAALVNGDKSHAEFEEKNTATVGKLISDIDLKNREWIPIRGFTGTFDGENHTVSGMKITKTQNDTGFFGKIYKATVQNLSVKGSITLSGSSQRIGGVIGYADGGSVEQVFSYVDISNTNVGLKHTGGIIGCVQNNEVKIEKCIYYGSMNINESDDCIGGILGYSNGGARISNCVNMGTVHTTKASALTGGILGYVNNNNPSIQNCYNYGKVSNDSNNNCCGAIIGLGKRYDASKIKNNYFLDTSAEQGFGSSGRTDGEAVLKTDKEFASGEVAYLLNQKVTDGTQVWYQNIDNGKPDSYPVLEGGIVYLLDSGEYSNVPAWPTAFEKDEEGNLIISTYDDLVKLAELVRSDYRVYGSQNYILKNNIAADGKSEWTMGIGSVSENKPFNGTFHGQGYCIMGLSVNSPEYGGLFEIIGEKGSVDNLFLINCKYTSDCKNAGGIAAVNNGVIDHCTNGINVSPYLIFPHPQTKTPVQAISFNSEISGYLSGGIAAQNTGSIIGCRNAASVTGDECGGISGINTGNIYGCANNGTIGKEALAAEVAGGISGRNGGKIEGSYHAGSIWAVSDKKAGSVVGLNGMESKNSPQITNVFYRKVIDLSAIGTDSAVTDTDNTVKAKEAAEMQSDAFLSELNLVTDSTVKWCRSNTLNGGYPKIETGIFKQMVKNLNSGITVKGTMHTALNISCEPFDKSGNEYSKLIQNIKNNRKDKNKSIDNLGRKVIKAYNISLSDNSGNSVLADMWIQGEIEMSVPVENEDILLSGFTSDGKLLECRPISYKNGEAVFRLPEPMSFVIIDNSMAAGEKVQTGDETDMLLWIFMSCMAAVAVGVGIKKRSRVN